MPQPPLLPDDHARHDELLVARLAAREELPEDERSMAARLVATCPACAALSADLALIARAVAREPMPQRRRDFRITPEQAERLRGSRLQRLLRRITLPESTLLRPAAAGVMSLGLLLVVVGTVVPGANGLGVAPGAEPLAQPPAAADALATHVSDELTQDVAARATTKVTDPGDVGDTTFQEDGALGLDMTLEGAVDDAAAAGTMRAAAPEAEAAPESGPALESGLAAEMASASEEQPPTEDATMSTARDGTGPAAAEGGLGPGTLLVVLGAVLALGGLLVLLMGVLVRRLVADPLIR